MAQSSAFTIHSEVIALENLPNAEQFLYRFEIPAGRKRFLGGDLFVLGIRKHYLFPDLENLSEAIIEELEAYDPPPDEGRGRSADAGR